MLDTTVSSRTLSVGAAPTHDATPIRTAIDRTSQAAILATPERARITIPPAPARGDDNIDTDITVERLATTASDLDSIRDQLATLLGPNEQSHGTLDQRGTRPTAQPSRVSF
eukprot:2034371-Pleurochrysis_carterae.AAC.1